MEVEATGFTLEQLKVFGTTETRFTVPQLSVDPLFTCAGVIVTVPAGFSCIIMFWQVAVGGWLSVTTTLNVQLLLPLMLVAVAVTNVVPT